jgi:hypothetical protein
MHDYIYYIQIFNQPNNFLQADRNKREYSTAGVIGSSCRAGRPLKNGVRRAVSMSEFTVSSSWDGRKLIFTNLIGEQVDVA